MAAPVGAYEARPNLSSPVWVPVVRTVNHTGTNKGRGCYKARERVCLGARQRWCVGVDQCTRGTHAGRQLVVRPVLDPPPTQSPSE